MVVQGVFAVILLTFLHVAERSALEINPEVFPLHENNPTEDGRLEEIIRYVRMVESVKEENALDGAAKIRNTIRQLEAEFIKFRNFALNVSSNFTKTEEKQILELENKVVGTYLQLEAEVNNTVDLIENLRSDLRDKTLHLCLAQIEAERFTDCKIEDNYLLRKIIIDAYDSNIGNLKKILKFIHTLDKDKWNTWAIGYTTLLNEIEKDHDLYKPQIFGLAYILKDILMEPNHSLSPDNRNLFENLKQRLPPIVRTIVWDRLCIKNKFYDEYLYAGDDETKFDVERRRLFTSPQREETASATYWRIEPTTADAVQFRVKNTQYNEYLYAPYIGLDEGKREAFTWDQGKNDNDCSNNQCSWELIINKEESIQMKNIRFGEYLYAGANFHNQTKRRVFTWTANDIDAQFMWHIASC